MCILSIYFIYTEPIHDYGAQTKGKEIPCSGPQ